MTPKAVRCPRVAISASVSCRNGCQLRIPTNTGSAGPPSASATSSADACARVSSFSGDPPPGIRS
jgi:hypothetical protein